MSEKLWVEYRVGKESHITEVSTEGCEFVANLINGIRKEPQLSIPQNAYITLYGPSWVAINVTDPTSSLVPGNSTTNPLRVQVSLPLATHKVGFDAEVTSFWNSLSGISEKYGFLHFPIRPCFFPTHMEALYVRKSYEAVFAMIYNNHSPEDPEKRRHRMTISGSPGIGKSVFLFYILWRLANDTTTKTVILHRESDGGRIYVFQNDGCWRAHEIHEVHDLLRDPTTWYLLDSFDSRPREVEATTIWATYLGIHFKMYFRYIETVHPYYLPVWSLEELNRVASLYSKDLQLVKERYHLIGGIPRFVLERNNDLKKGIGRALSSLSVGRMFNFASDAEYNQNRISHFIIHCLADSTYSKYSLIFSSQYVAGLVLKELLESQDDELKRWLCSEESLGHHRTLQANLFEQCAHRLLAAGGKFVGRSLDDGTRLELNVPRRRVKMFDDISECSDPSAYYVSRYWNYHCIDSVMLNEGYFRMMMAEEHDIPGGEMMKLIKELRMGKLYLVVPDRFSYLFKRQKLECTTMEHKGVEQDQVVEGLAVRKQKMEEPTWVGHCPNSTDNSDGSKKLRVTNDQDSIGLQAGFLRQYVICIPIDNGWETIRHVLLSTYKIFGEEDC
jgi:hypothetical protein